MTLGSGELPSNVTQSQLDEARSDPRYVQTDAGSEHRLVQKFGEGGDVSSLTQSERELAEAGEIYWREAMPAFATKEYVAELERALSIIKRNVADIIRNVSQDSRNIQNLEEVVSEQITTHPSLVFTIQRVLLGRERGISEGITKNTVEKITRELITVLSTAV